MDSGNQALVFPFAHNTVFASLTRPAAQGIFVDPAIMRLVYVLPDRMVSSIILHLIVNILTVR